MHEKRCGRQAASRKRPSVGCGAARYSACTHARRGAALAKRSAGDAAGDAAPARVRKAVPASAPARLMLRSRAARSTHLTSRGPRHAPLYAGLASCCAAVVRARATRERSRLRPPRAAQPRHGPGRGTEQWRSLAERRPRGACASKPPWREAAPLVCATRSTPVPRRMGGSHLAVAAVARPSQLEIGSDSSRLFGATIRTSRRPSRPSQEGPTRLRQPRRPCDGQISNSVGCATQFPKSGGEEGGGRRKVL